jgi:Sua5/YciO/YrdC/YwlC family protein
MLLKIHSQGIEEGQVKQIADTLNKGGLIIYPTDTVYALACRLGEYEASQRLSSLKEKKFEKSNFSIVCNNISQASTFVKPLTNDLFKLLKQNTPGAFTFVLPASGKIPKILQTKKRTIGIRIPQSDIVTRIIDQLGYPLLTSSLPHQDMEEECFTLPEYFVDLYEDKVDLIVDNGQGQTHCSTVIDLTEGDINIIRQGLGELKY